MTVAAVAGLGIGAPASAQVLEEITVTAQKREESLQDVGVAVTAFSGDAMNDLGMKLSVDVAAQTPGLTMSTSDGLNNILNIRGVSQNDFGTHQEAPVTVYIDEGYISNQALQRITNLDIERVEVLRGPQGTLFGRNATGGLLHFVTRKPSFDGVEGDFAVEAGQRGLLRLRGGVGGPLSEKVAARFAASYGHNDKYVTNIGTGPDGGEAKQWTARGTLVAQPTDSFQATLSFNAFDENNDSSSYGTQPSFVNNDGLSVAAGPGTGPEIIASNHPTLWDSSGNMLNLKLVLDAAGGTITSVTAVLDHEAAHDEDADTQSDPWGALGIPGTTIEDNIVIWSRQKNEQLTQELRYDRELGNGGNWVVGVYFMDRESDTFQRVDWGTSFDTLGVAVPPIGAPFGSDTNISLQTKSRAVFSQVGVPLSDTVSLTAGIRYTEDDLDFSFLPDDYIRLEPGIEGDRLYFGVVPTLRSHSEDDYSGKVQLDWRPNDNTLWYAGFSRGTKGGGYNGPYLDGTAGVVDRFKGEVLHAFEVGVKSDISEKVRLNASAFKYDYKDYQGFAFEGLTALLQNIDGESHGMEVELTAYPADGLDILFGLAYLDAELDTGARMPLSPELAVNALVRKSFELGNGGQFAVQLDGNWTDDQEMDTINSPSVQIKAKHTLNVRLTYTGSNDRFSVALIGRNIMDEENLSFAVPVGFLGYDQMMYEKPSWWSVELAYNF